MVVFRNPFEQRFPECKTRVRCIKNGSGSGFVGWLRQELENTAGRVMALRPFCSADSCDHDHRPANSSQFASTAAVFYGSSRTIRSFIPAEPVSDWEREVRRVRQASKVWPSGFIRPVEKQWVVSSGFGSRWGRFHNGVDLAAPMGAPILAADSGTVTYAAYEPRGYGHIVEVTHSDGWQTLYAHSQRIFPRVGDKVERGECIATVGCSGRVTGPHLHWEIRDPSGKPVDPSLFCHDLH